MCEKAQLFEDLSYLALHDLDALKHILDEFQPQRHTFTGQPFESLPTSPASVVVLRSQHGFTVDVVENESGQRWRIIE